MATGLMNRKNTTWPRRKRVSEHIQWNFWPLLLCSSHHPTHCDVLPLLKFTFEISVAKIIHRRYLRRIRQPLFFGYKLDLMFSQPLHCLRTRVTCCGVHVQDNFSRIFSVQLGDVFEHHWSQHLVNDNFCIHFEVLGNTIKPSLTSPCETCSIHNGTRKLWRRSCSGLILASLRHLSWLVRMRCLTIREVQRQQGFIQTQNKLFVLTSNQCCKRLGSFLSFCLSWPR